MLPGTLTDDPTTYAESPYGDMPSVLVVDDEEMNRRIISDTLSSAGNHVLTASSGAECLEICDCADIDTILLDIMMPGTDGFEVCRQLKKSPSTRHIPILMVTALNDRAHCLEGIHSGASDFISKPIDAQYLRLRVKNATDHKRLHDQVSSDFHRLQRLESMREDLTNMIVHDLRSPLTGITATLELLKAVHATELSTGATEMVEAAAAEAGWMANLINSMLDVSRMDHQQLEVDAKCCDLEAHVRNAIKSLGPKIGQCQIKVLTPENAPTLHADPQLFDRILMNLIGNAVKFGADSITINARPKGNRHLRISVTDNGSGIALEDQSQMFDKYKTKNSGNTPSSGLGLTFCKLAVEAQGGSIGLDSELGEGTTIWFDLPLSKLVNAA